MINRDFQKAKEIWLAVVVLFLLFSFHFPCLMISHLVLIFSIVQLLLTHFHWVQVYCLAQGLYSQLLCCHIHEALVLIFGDIVIFVKYINMVELFELTSLLKGLCNFLWCQPNGIESSQRPRFPKVKHYTCVPSSNIYHIHMLLKSEFIALYIWFYCRIF